MARALGVLLLPAVTAGLAAFLLVIPSIDPLRDNIAKFEGSYYGFPGTGVAAMLIILLTTALVPVEYSYVLWRRLGRPAPPA